MNLLDMPAEERDVWAPSARCALRLCVHHYRSDVRHQGRARVAERATARSLAALAVVPHILPSEPVPEGESYASS